MNQILFWRLSSEYLFQAWPVNLAEVVHNHYATEAHAATQPLKMGQVLAYTPDRASQAVFVFYVGAGRREITAALKDLLESQP